MAEPPRFKLLLNGTHHLSGVKCLWIKKPHALIRRGCTGEVLILDCSLRSHLVKDSTEIVLMNGFVEKIASL
jgi:hypothetical protein